MWKPRQQALLAATSFAVLTAGLTAGVTGATADVGAANEPRPAPATHSVDRSQDWDRAGTRGGAGTGVGRAAFTGHDGLVHDPSPLGVHGGDGVVFYGEDFDAACAFGEKFDRGLKRIARLVDAIEDSGRHVAVLHRTQQDCRRQGGPRRSQPAARQVRRPRHQAAGPHAGHLP